MRERFRWRNCIRITQKVRNCLNANAKVAPRAGLHQPVQHFIYSTAESQTVANVAKQEASGWVDGWTSCIGVKWPEYTITSLPGACCSHVTWWDSSENLLNTAWWWPIRQLFGVEVNKLSGGEKGETETKRFWYCQNSRAPHVISQQKAWAQRFV